jgi:plasmid stabilization system protein ParE
VKEPIFHPEARAEARETVEFYEARLDGLGLRFLAAVEVAAERVSANPEVGAPLAGGFRKRIVPGFPYNIIYRVWEDYIYLVAVAHTTVVRAIGAREPIAAEQRLEESFCAPPSARQTASLYGFPSIERGILPGSS